MKIAVGSQGEHKLAPAREALEQLLGPIAEVVGSAAISGVPGTPWEEETIQGAINRASHAAELVPDATYGLGVESGLVTRGGRVFEEVWCSVFEPTTGKRNEAYSSGLQVPQIVLDRMAAGEAHGDIMADMERGLDTAHLRDTWALYSGGLVPRGWGTIEAVRNALVPFIIDRKH